MANLSAPSDSDNRKRLFPTFCDAEAALYLARRKSLHDAVDACQDYAVGYGIVAAIGQDEVQLIMARAFARVRNDLDGWVVP